MLEAKDVILRYCKLQATVARHLGYPPSDCFCGQSGFWGSRGYGPTHEQGYRNDGTVLEYIESAVRDRMAAHELMSCVKQQATGTGSPFYGDPAELHDC